MASGLLRPYATGREFESFRTNVEKQDSVVRRLEIIGEAVKGILNASRVVTVPAIAPTNGTGSRGASSRKQEPWRASKVKAVQAPSRRQAAWRRSGRSWG